MTSTNWQKI